MAIIVHNRTQTLSGTLSSRMVFLYQIMSKNRNQRDVKIYRLIVQRIFFCSKVVVLHTNATALLAIDARFLVSLESLMYHLIESNRPRLSEKKTTFELTFLGKQCPNSVSDFVENK